MDSESVPFQNLSRGTDKLIQDSVDHRGVSTLWCYKDVMSKMRFWRMIKRKLGSIHVWRGECHGDIIALDVAVNMIQESFLNILMNLRNVPPSISKQTATNSIEKAAVFS